LAAILKAGGAAATREYAGKFAEEPMSDPETEEMYEEARQAATAMWEVVSDMPPALAKLSMVYCGPRRQQDSRIRRRMRLKSSTSSTRQPEATSGE
jgi:hypothetical protein